MNHALAPATPTTVIGLSVSDFNTVSALGHNELTVLPYQQRGRRIVTGKALGQLLIDHDLQILDR